MLHIEDCIHLEDVHKLTWRLVLHIWREGVGLPRRETISRLYYISEFWDEFCVNDAALCWVEPSSRCLACSDKTGGWSSVLHKVGFLLPDHVPSSWTEPCSVNSLSLGGNSKVEVGSWRNKECVRPVWQMGHRFEEEFKRFYFYFFLHGKRPQLCFFVPFKNQV